MVAWREAPAQVHEFDATFGKTEDRGSVGRPDIVSGFEIGDGLGHDQGQPRLAERFDVGTIGHSTAKVVAHGGLLPGRMHHAGRPVRRGRGAACRRPYRPSLLP